MEESTNPFAETVFAGGLITLRCFGCFKALTSDGTEIKWRTSKAEELLAYLTHHQGQAVERARIMDALWGDDSRNTAAYMNTTAYYMRENLSSAGVTDVLEYSKGYYRIRMEVFDSHLLSFERALSSACSVDADDISSWEKAAALYSGGYLADNDYAWTEQRRLALEKRYIELVLRISSHYKEEGRQTATIKLLKKAIKQVSWCEAFHTELICAFLATHDRLAALRQYDALKRMLRREHGMEPGDDIKRLLHLRY